MSGPEADELPPMSEDVRTYLRAFAAEERPTRERRASTWAAVEAEVGRGRRRVAMFAVASVVALAAAVVLVVFGVRGEALQRAPAEPSMQTPWEGGEPGTAGEVDRSSGDAEVRTARPASPAAAVERATAAPVPEPPSADVSPRPRRTSSASTARVSVPSETTPATDAGVGEETGGPSLAEELALFRRAKLALVDEDFARALELLDEHRGRFPAGAFRREGTVLRAEALCAVGRTAEATKLRDRFLQRHATSALVGRMRSVCR